MRRGFDVVSTVPLDHACEAVIAGCRHARASSERVRQDTWVLMSMTLDVCNEHQELRRQTVHKLLVLSQMMNQCIELTLRCKRLRCGRTTPASRQTVKRRPPSATDYCIK